MLLNQQKYTKIKIKYRFFFRDLRKEYQNRKTVFILENKRRKKKI